MKILAIIVVVLYQTPFKKEEKLRPMKVASTNLPKSNQFKKTPLKKIMRL